MREPSFYFCAMYVNYGLIVAFFLAVFIIAKVISWSFILHSFIAIIITSMLVTSLFLRLSRIIWINMFVSYSCYASKPQKRMIKQL